MLFLRQVNVIIGSQDKGISIDYDPDLEGFDINIKIKKSRVSYPNECEIDIINLAPSTIASIQNEFTDVLVNAGYKNNVGQMFVGRIKNLVHLIDGTDTITKIFAADADADWQTGTINTTFEGSVGLEDRVRALVKTFNETVTIGTLQGLDQPLVSQTPATYSGSTKDQMDVLADTYNFDWSIQDGKFETIARGTAINNQSQGILVSAASGMIGSPEITEIGVNVKTFFNQALLPNRYIVVDANGADVQLGDPYFKPVTRQDTATGPFIINTVTHFMQTRGNEGTSSIEARRPGVL